MGQEIIIKIEGLEALTKAMIVLAGSIQDHTTAMGKQGAMIEITSTNPGIIDFKKIADEMGIEESQDEDPGVELAVRDMYYHNKAKNNMIMIKKGQPLEVPVGFKATTKAKYDEFFGDDGHQTDDPVTTPGDSEDYDPVPWTDGTEYDEEPTVSMEDVRAKFVALDKATEKGAAKKILVALGVDKLMDMDPADYPKALNMAEGALKKAGK